MARVLLADDSAFFRSLVSDWIRSGGHEVLEVSDGREAVEQVLDDRPDIILLDLAMPRQDGFGVLEELRQRDIRVPVVVCTADIQETTRQRCEQLGAARLVSKPSGQRELLDALDEALCSGEEASP
jgi:twitching motility two-component system response regulator PilH